MTVTLTLTGIVSLGTVTVASVTTPFTEVQDCLNGATAITPDINGGTVDGITSLTVTASGTATLSQATTIARNGGTPSVLTMQGADSGNEGAEVRMEGAATYATVYIDRFQDNLRFFRTDAIAGVTEIIIGSNASSGGDLNLRTENDIEIDGALNHDGSTVGFYNGTPVTQYATTGTLTGFTAGVGTGVNNESTFTGDTGSTAYTISDLVRALKLVNLIAS